MAHDERAANRAAANRARSAADQATSAATAKAEARLGEASRMREEIERLIPLALAARAVRDYDGIVQITIQRKTLFGYKDKRVGAYKVCTVHAMAHGEPFPRDVMLTSDGRLSPWELPHIMDMMHKFEAMSGPFSIDGLKKIADGLRALSA